MSLQARVVNLKDAFIESVKSGKTVAEAIEAIGLNIGGCPESVDIFPAERGEVTGVWAHYLGVRLWNSGECKPSRFLILLTKEDVDPSDLTCGQYDILK